MTPKRGTRGKQGKRGARGPKMTRTEIVAIVKEQYFEERFSQIQQQLDVQLRRTGEIQARSSIGSCVGSRTSLVVAN